MLRDRDYSKQLHRDMYVVVGLSSLSMLACVCCFCCWMRCKPEELGGRQIENSLGLDLQSTDRGATITNIKKFPPGTQRWAKTKVKQMTRAKASENTHRMPFQH